MEQKNNPFIKYRNNSYYNNGIYSRNQHKSNNTVINLVNIIYDNEFVSLINNLSSSLKDCFKLLNELLYNIKEISVTLGNQILHSKCLLNDLNKNKNEKLLQINDRLDFIDNNKNLLDNNISLMNVNISTFLGHAKSLFKKMKTKRNDTINSIKNLKSANNLNNTNYNRNYNTNYYSIEK